MLQIPVKVAVMLSINPNGGTDAWINTEAALKAAPRNIE
jgi:hypothetical protein